MYWFTTDKMETNTHENRTSLNGLYPVSDYNHPIMFNHWHIWSITSIIFLEEEFFQLPSSTAVKSLDMKQTEKHFSNKHIYKAS